MLSSRHRFLYIHIPKTGGNSVQTRLLPLSEDTPIRERHQDGRDRFELLGPHTPAKHADLQSYADSLPGGLAGWRVLAAVRHPFARAVSGYFTPGRWMRRDAGGTWTATEPHWDETAFWAMIDSGRHRAAADYLRVDGTLRMPDTLLRAEHLAGDFRACVAHLGLPVDPVLPRLNRSAAPDALRRRVLGSAALRDAVEARFAEDMDAFGYGRYEPAPS